MKGLSAILKNIPANGYAYFETTPEQYKKVMRECHNPRHKKQFTCEAYTAVPAREISTVQILVRIQHHDN